MNKLIETAKELDRILESGIEILPNSPIHEKLKQSLNIACVNNCPAWLDSDDFEFAKELYKENKLDAVKYVCNLARPHVLTPLKTSKELLEGCC